MSKVNPREVLDLFGYVILSAPSFPPEDETNTDLEIARLTKAIKAIHSNERSKERKQWLALCLKELEGAARVFRSGEEDKGLELIQSAEAHFKNALAGKSIEPAFELHANGQATKVSEE